MARFGSVGIRGYTGAKRVYRARRPRRGKIRRNRRFARRVRKAVENYMLEKANYHVTTSSRVVAPVGEQRNATIMVQNSHADISGIYGNIIAPVTGGQPSSILHTMKFTITSYAATIAMKNQTQSNVILDMYIVVPRQDQQNALPTLMTDSFNDQGLPFGENTYGTTPYMAQQFTVMNKILSKTRYVLAPGATDFIEYRDPKNYQIDYERIINNVANVSYRGLTKSFFVIVRGEPVDDVTTPTLVSATQAAVIFNMSETYFYTFCPQNVTQTSQSIGFDTLTTPNSVLIDTGAIINPNVA